MTRVDGRSTGAEGPNARFAGYSCGGRHGGADSRYNLWEPELWTTRGCDSVDGGRISHRTRARWQVATVSVAIVVVTCHNWPSRPVMPTVRSDTLSSGLRAARGPLGQE